MCISRRPFPWLTITVRCWPGVLRLTSQIASGRRGIGRLEIWGKLTFRPNLCYFSTSEKNWLREEDRLGDFTRVKRPQKPIFDCGGQGCRIICTYWRVAKIVFLANKLLLKKEERQRICIVKEPSAPGANKWGYPAAALEKHGCVSYPVASTLNAAIVRPDF